MQLRSGPESVPAPVVEIFVYLFEWDPAVAARMVVTLELSAAAAVLLTGSRVLALAMMAGFGFVALACVSAAIRAGGMPVPLASLAIAAAAIWFVARGDGRGSARARGLSPAWSALLALAVASATARMSSALEFPREPDPAAKAKANSIDLDLKPYVGKPISETPIAAYLPRIVADLGAETAFLVFYNPRCDACHNLFEAHFSEPRLERVIAVEIPPPPDAVLVEADHYGPIECPSCEFESLPPGPLWLIAPPMTVKVERGVIVCVADRFGGDCLNPQ